jgi:hypothetical protein
MCVLPPSGGAICGFLLVAVTGKTAEEGAMTNAMTHAMAIDVERKPRRRGLSTKQKASSLFRLWHGIQDIKEDADRMKDEELGLLVGMIELLVEERAAGLGRRGAALAAADTTRPN